MIYEKQSPLLNQDAPVFPEAPNHSAEASSSLLTTPSSNESGRIRARRLRLEAFEMDGMRGQEHREGKRVLLVCLRLEAVCVL